MCVRVIACVRVCDAVRHHYPPILTSSVSASVLMCKPCNYASHRRRCVRIPCTMCTCANIQMRTEPVSKLMFAEFTSGRLFSGCMHACMCEAAASRLFGSCLATFRVRTAEDDTLCGCGTNPQIMQIIRILCNGRKRHNILIHNTCS